MARMVRSLGRWGLICVMLGCYEDDLDLSVTEQQTTKYKRASEEPLEKLSQVVPEFGGFYCDNGNLVVLTTPANAIAQSAIKGLIDPEIVASCLDFQHQAHTPDVVFATSKYRFSSLQKWRNDLADSFLSTPGSISIGISYKANRLRMSVKSYALEDVASLPAIAELPADAFELTTGEFPVKMRGCDINNIPQTATYDCFWPVPGSVQIVNGATNEGCTLGAAGARFNGAGWIPGWLTNSHCLPPTWRMNSVSVWQPNNYSGPPFYDSSNMIGYETVDPPGFPCGTRECRYSDAAWINASPAFVGQVPDRGRIARTDPSLGTHVVDPKYSRFSVISYRYPLPGMVVHKIGKT